MQTSTQKERTEEKKEKKEDRSIAVAARSGSPWSTAGDVVDDGQGKERRGRGGKRQVGVMEKANIPQEYASLEDYSVQATRYSGDRKERKR